MLSNLKRKAPESAPEPITLPDAALHVVPGRALVTMRGALSHCAVIEASDLPGGEARLRELFSAGRVMSHDDAVAAFSVVESSVQPDEAAACRRNLGLDSPSDHFGANIPALPAAKQRAKDAQKIVDNFERQHPGIVAELAQAPSAEGLAENGSWVWVGLGNAGVKLSELGASVRAALSELAAAKVQLDIAQRATELALARQTSRFAIAPGRTVQLPSGPLKRAGDAIEPGDFVSRGQRDDPADVWARHLASGTIIEKAPEPTEAVA